MAGLMTGLLLLLLLLLLEELPSTGDAVECTRESRSLWLAIVAAVPKLEPVDLLLRRTGVSSPLSFWKRTVLRCVGVDALECEIEDAEDESAETGPGDEVYGGGPAPDGGDISEARRGWVRGGGI